MKKLIAICLMVTLFVSCTILTYAYTLDPSLSLAEAVETICRDYNGEDIWFPLFPERYEIKSLKVQEDGIYRVLARDTQRILGEDFVAVLLISDQYEKEEYSSEGGGYYQYEKEKSISGLHCGYYGLLSKKNAANPLQVSRENLELIQEEDFYKFESNEIGDKHYFYVNKKGGLGQYGHWNSTVNWWEVGGTAIVGTSHWEVAVGLSDSTLASISTRLIAPQAFSDCDVPWPQTKEEMPGYCEQVLDISFTTFGDANLNGKVDAVDALAILQHAAEKKVISQEMAFLMADSDQSNTLDAKDALTALQIAVGK